LCDAALAHRRAVGGARFELGRFAFGVAQLRARRLSILAVACPATTETGRTTTVPESRPYYELKSTAGLGRDL
jgi:hypothetical protein